jgi:hypothetical protein
MPPTKALPPEYVDIFKRWVLAGAPNTAAEAAAIAPPGGAIPGVTTTPVITTTLPVTATLPLTTTLTVTPAP